MESLWRVYLFDGPRLLGNGGAEVRRFRSQRVAALLAYLALRLGKDVSREELAEALWPEEDPKVTANRLRVSLTSLRRQLEPPGVSPGSVLDASRAGYIRLRRESVSCDVLDFDVALKRGEMTQAVGHASGSLLPGFFDEWILSERERLEALKAELPEPAPPQAISTATASEPPAPEIAHSHLPLYLTRFFGRETERDALARLLSENRLVTIVASGGMGKTRLSVEAARTQPLPTVFVALADLPDAERLPEVILRALDVRGRVDSDLRELLVAALARRAELLMILDNAEHVVEAASELVWSLLEAVPNLRVLVTSRHALDLPGEARFPLAPLEPPPVSGTVAQLAEFPAVALFLDRARAVHPDYALSERHAAGLVALCQKLEGIPLALELAAARIHVQTPTQILESLIERPTELGSRLRALPVRHRSLRAVVESSLELLSPQLQASFAALSVFQGGWTAEGAEAVGVPEEALAELLSRSLVLRKTDGTDIARFTALETLRQFGAERLVSPAREAVQRRHAAHFLTLASRGDEHDARTLGPLDAELENLELALGHGWETIRDGAFWNALTGFLTFAFVRGHQRRATVWAERAVAEWRTVEPPERRFELLHRALMLYNDLGRWDEIATLAAELRAEAQQTGKLRWAVEGLEHRAYTASQRFQHEDAVRLQRQALAEARELGDRKTLIRALISMNRVTNPLAELLGSQALWKEAEAASREALALESEHSRYQANIHMGLYLAVGAQSRFQESYDALKKSQDYAWKLQAMALLMYSFYFEQAVEMKFGSPERAALLSGAFSRLREQMGYVHPSVVEEERWQNRLREAISPAVYERQVRLAYQLTLAELVVPRTWDVLIASQKNFQKNSALTEFSR